MAARALFCSHYRSFRGSFARFYFGALLQAIEPTLRSIFYGLLPLTTDAPVG